MHLPVQEGFTLEFDTSEQEFLRSLGFLDLCEEVLAQLPQVQCETTHEFLKAGFYVRTIYMPKGLLLTSKIHRTEHPYTVSYGEVKVWTQKMGTVHISGKYSGITPANTKRLIFVLEDTKWTTFHQGDWKTVEEANEDIIEPHINTLINIPYADCYNRPAKHRLDGTPIDHDYVLHND